MRIALRTAFTLLGCAFFTLAIQTTAYAQAATGGITGNVRAQVGGAGVSGATVTFWASNGSFAGTTVTNAAGTYTSPGLVPGTYYVRAEAAAPSYLITQIYQNITCSGSQCSVTNGTPVAVTSGATTSAISFSMPAGAKIGGTVTRADSSAPVANVTLSFYDVEGDRVATTTTNASGQYTSPAIPAGTSYFIVASPPNAAGLIGQLYGNVACPAGACRAKDGQVVTVNASNTTSPISFTLQPGGTIAGTLTHANTSAPLSGVRVEFRQGELGRGSTTSNASGQYTSPPLPAGTYRVTARTEFAAGLTNLIGVRYPNIPCPGSACGLDDGTGVVVTVPAQTPNINMALQPGGIISGTVMSDDGPVSDAVVGVYDATSYVGTLVPSAQGTYTSMGLPSGGYYLEVNPAPGSPLVSQVYGGAECPPVCRAVEGTAITVTAPNTTSGRNFTLARGSLIKGRVVRTGTTTGIADVNLNFYTPDGTLVGRARSGSTGSYESVALPTGSYLAKASSTHTQSAILHQGVTCMGCEVTQGTPIPVTRPTDVNGLNIGLPTAPAATNDLYGNAVNMVALPFHAIANIGSATATSDPAVSCGNHSNQRSVWYTVTPSTGGILAIDTFGSSYDTILSVYTGGPGNFDQVACNDDVTFGEYGRASRVSFAVTAGTKYSVMVSSIGVSQGTLGLNAAMEPPVIGTTPTALQFGATKAGAGAAAIVTTPPQAVTVTFQGGTASWTASSPQTWIQITNGSGTGPGQFTVAIVNPGNVIGGSTALNGNVVLTAAGTQNAPLTVPVTLAVNQSGGASTAPPFGLVDTPLQNTTGVTGTIGVTGWVLDDIGVAGVRIYRNCLGFEDPVNCVPVNGRALVFVGDATMVTGARPDVEALYPAYPQSSRAAWGYLLMTNLLPHVPNQQMFGGQGTLTLHVLATDVEGKQVWLGRNTGDATPTTFTMANDTIAKPFGAIDTPAQGATVSGTIPNFGWALTPDANTTAGAGDILVPTAGNTIHVYIDGTPRGTVSYNQCRGTTASGPVPAGVYCNDDVSSIFGFPAPQATFTPRTGNPTKYRNLDAGRGAIGAYLLDTTGLANGVHTIMWGVVDTNGRNDGIGSRYFTVLNTGSDQPDPGESTAARRSGAGIASPRAGFDAPIISRGRAEDLDDRPVSYRPMWIRTGLGLDTPWVEAPPDDEGVRRVRIPDLGRLVISMGEGVDEGYLAANGLLRDLPPGSQLDSRAGVFTWAPGVGFLGRYHLLFVTQAGRAFVDVTIEPQLPRPPDGGEVRMTLDLPHPGSVLPRHVRVAGWAADPWAAVGSGVSAVHVWGVRVDAPGSGPVFLGAAALGGSRPDVAALLGAQFGLSAFDLTTSALDPGEYEVTAYVQCARTGRWEDARSVRIAVR